MSAQFIHFEEYSMTPKGDKPDAIGVLKEARREESHSKHISGEKFAKRVYGYELEEVQRQLEKGVNQKINGRAVRKDARILLAGVASYPTAFKDKEYNKIEMLKWQKATILHLKKQFGDSLKSVVFHADEEQPHIHFYCYDTSKMNLREIHPGMIAEAKEKGKRAKAIAFKKALSEFQDSYFIEVSQKFGMTRTGSEPRERRNKEQQREINKIKNEYEAISAEKDKKNKEALSIIKEQAKTIEKLEEQQHRDKKLIEEQKSFINELKSKISRLNLDIDRLKTQLYNVYEAAKARVYEELKIKKIGDKSDWNDEDFSNFSL